MAKIDSQPIGGNTGHLDHAWGSWSDYGALGAPSYTLNLAPDPDEPRLLRPVALPSKLSTTDGKPLLAVGHEGGASILVAMGCTLLAVNAATGTRTEIATLEEAPLCAVASGGYVMVMTGEGVNLLTRDSSTHRWQWLGTMPELPAVTLCACQDTPVSATVASSVLAGVYPLGHGVLSRDDTKVLTSDALEAYSSIVDKAASAGLAVQPIMAAYRLLDVDGVELYRSSPVLVSSGGFQLAEMIEAPASPTSGERPGAVLRARGYKLSCSVSGELSEEWAKRVAALEVLASAPLHLVDYNGRAYGALQAGGGLEFALPGIAPGEVGSRGAALVRGVLERAGTMMSVVAKIAYPFAYNRMANAVVIDLPLSGNAPAEVSRQQSLLKQPPSPWLTSPLAGFHISCSAVSRCGNSIAMANLLLRRRRPDSTLSLAATTGAERWRVSMAALDSSGNVLATWGGQGESGGALTFSPLICYPSADAVTLELRATDSRGRAYQERLAMTSVGSMAYFLHPSLAPWAPAREVAAYVAHTSKAAREERPGWVASTVIWKPMEVVSAVPVTAAPIVAVTPASRSSSAWSFGKAHFYCFSREGVHSLALNNGAVLNGADNIDRRGVANASLVALGARCVYVLACGSLIEVSGNKTTTIMSDVEATAIGWSDAADGELWLLVDSSTALVYSMATGFRGYRSINANSLWCDGNRLLAPSSDGLYEVSPRLFAKAADSSLTPVAARWSRTLSAGAVDMRLEVPLIASEVDVEVEVMAVDHPRKGLAALERVARRVAKFGVAGVARRGFSRVFAMPSRRYLTIDIEGSVSADATLYIGRHDG